MLNTNKLAINGGEPIVDKKFQKFTHPVISNELIQWFNSRQNIEDITVFDANIITQLQDKMKEVFDIKYTLATNSGTSAIFKMFYTLDLNPGDEVLVPVYTFFATATPLFVLGCKPILVDCLDNGNISPKDIRKKITSKTKAITITHMWGIPCDMDEIMDISREYNIPVLEDSSHAHGTIYKGKTIGSFGKSSAWSLGTKKIITGGQGGVFATNDKVIYEKAILSGHANNKRLNDVSSEELLPFAITGTGLNLRMHPYAAKVIFEQFVNLNTQLSERRSVAKYLSEEINKINGLSPVRIPENSEASWYAFPVLFDKHIIGVSKEKFVEALIAEGAVGVDIPGSTCPLTEFPAFRKSIVNFANDKNYPELYNLEMFPGAKMFQDKMFKFPMWYGDNSMEYAYAYIEALKKVISNIADLKND